MRIVFSPDSLEDQRYFKEHAPKAAEKIVQLLENIMQSPYSGLGKPEPLKHGLSGFWSRRINREHSKPEPLKHGLSGFWSRRINREHRLVYKIDDDTIYVISCRYHY